MVQHTLDESNSVLIVQPKESLGIKDFQVLAETVDPDIEKSGSLTGFIIDAPTFPGWESFGAMAAQIRFVKDHHQHIKKVALVTGSSLGNLAETLASHFVSAQIKHFHSSELDAAKEWVTADE